MSQEESKIAYIKKIHPPEEIEKFLTSMGFESEEDLWEDYDIYNRYFLHEDLGVWEVTHLLDDNDYFAKIIDNIGEDEQLVVARYYNGSESFNCVLTDLLKKSK